MHRIFRGSTCLNWQSWELHFLERFCDSISWVVVSEPHSHCKRPQKKTWIINSCCRKMYKFSEDRLPYIGSDENFICLTSFVKAYIYLLSLSLIHTVHDYSTNTLIKNPCCRICTKASEDRLAFYSYGYRKCGLQEPANVSFGVFSIKIDLEMIQRSWKQFQ